MGGRPAGSARKPFRKQIGQTGSRLQRGQRLRDRCDALRNRGHVLKAGESDFGSPSASRTCGSGLLAGCSRQIRRQELDPRSVGATGRCGPRRTDRHRENHAGVFAQNRHGVRAPLRLRELRAVRQDQREEPLSSTLNPLALYTKRMTRRRSGASCRLPDTRPMCLANCDGAGPAAVCGFPAPISRHSRSSITAAVRARRRPDNRSVGRGVPVPAET